MEIEVVTIISMFRSTINDIIPDKSFDKQSNPNNQYLQLLTHSYSAIPKNLRRQAKAIFVWYSKEKTDLG